MTNKISSNEVVRFKQSHDIPLEFEGCCYIVDIRVTCWLIVGRKNHRIGGPAIVYDDGTMFWYEHNKSHRLDGPSDIWAHGVTCYYIHGEPFEERNFWKHPLVQTAKLEKILEL